MFIQNFFKIMSSSGFKVKQPRKEYSINLKKAFLDTLKTTLNALTATCFIELPKVQVYNTLR